MSHAYDIAQQSGLIIWGMMQSYVMALHNHLQCNESSSGEQFLRSYGEQEQENQTVKTKKAPPPGGA